MKNPFYILLLFVFVLAIPSCKNKSETTKPTIENISESVYASGYVKAKNQYNVYATVTGIIQDIMVAEGDSVSKEMPIIKIQNQSSALNAENAKMAAELAKSGTDKLNELKAGLEIAKLKLSNDSSTYSRQKKLWEQQVGSLNELEQRELNYKNSQTNYNIALLRYNDAKKQYDFSTKQTGNVFQINNEQEENYSIKSKIDGRLYSLLKEKGELVRPEGPIAVIGSANDFYLELQVDENDIAKVNVGQKVLITLNSYKNQSFEATITKVNTIMNERTRSFTIEAKFNKTPSKLYPNLSVEANIILRSQQNALTIPRNYLIEDTYVLNESNEKIKVETGLKDYRKVEILSGITENDVIVKPEK